MKNITTAALVPNQNKMFEQWWKMNSATNPENHSDHDIIKWISQIAFEAGHRSFCTWPDQSNALIQEDTVCLWCTDPFLPGRDLKAVVLERTVLDRNGGHVETTWLHKDCALGAIAEIAAAAERPKSVVFAAPSWWPRFLELVLTRRPLIFSWIENAQPVLENSRRLIIYCRDELAQTALARSGNLKLLEEIVREIVGSACAVEITRYGLPAEESR
jgi:hypothetical protein